MAETTSIECVPVELTDERRANLTTLAAYLRTLPANYPDFEMSDFVQDGDNYFAHVACGTAACAIGHGPMAGIAPNVGEEWFAYSERAFIPRPDDVEGDTVEEPWNWCFASEWSSTDNTVHGAAARIEYLLENGCPINSRQQMRRRAPLCYTVGGVA